MSGDHSSYAAMPGAEGLSRKLAKYLVGAKPEHLPENVRHAGVQTFLNWLGCAVGGSAHEAVDIAIKAMKPFSGPEQSTIIGRRERMDVLNAALVNGIASHVFDFDDTHLKTVIHPAGPVASAIFALAEMRPVNGRDFLNALVLGVEVECRLGNAVFPDHYDRGWHITGSTGVLGAAAAVGKLIGLDEQRMLWALGIAAVQPVGLREMFGSMTKSFHPGRAAQNGLTAALLAEQGYTASNQGIEAKRGWAAVTSTKQDWSQIQDGLGESYEILINSYKPFACGIVIHPAIDGCIQLRNEHGLKAEDIAKIDLEVHPLVLELTGKKAPPTGLDGKFSVYHSCAAAIIRGKAGEPEYSDELVKDPVLVRLRDSITATVDPNIASDAVKVTMTLKDGRVLKKFVEHAIGSVAKPMTDKNLEVKFLDLCDGVLSADKARKLLDMAWKLESFDDVTVIAKAATP
ncbi:MAG TPA: MmgE/PrpD family protein [Stellaceae bacterium]|nr:MmgE/PrpD family protein [Stellaceae bacterium]